MNAEFLKEIAERDLKLMELLVKIPYNADVSRLKTLDKYYYIQIKKNGNNELKTLEQERLK